MRQNERRRLYLEAMRTFAEVRSAWARKPEPGSKEWNDCLARWDELISANAAYLRYLREDTHSAGELPR